MERIKEIYRGGGAVGGASAGAAVMSEVMIASDNNGIPVISEGFGFIDFAIIDQHFSQRDRQGRLILAAQGQNLPGIGIDEATAVVFNPVTKNFKVLGAGSATGTVTVYELQPTGIKTQIFNVGDSFTAVSLDGGRISFQQESVLPSGIRYEDFLGTYTMHYSTSPGNPTHTHNLTVAFEQAVQGKSFYLKGLLQDTDEALGNIEVLFDAYNGIDIQGNKYLFSRPDTESDLQVWMVAMTSEGTNSRLSGPNRGIMGTDYELINGKISFNTTNNGVSTNIAGFLFRIYPDNVNANTTNVNHRGGDYRLYYPRFVKQ